MNEKVLPMMDLLSTKRQIRNFKKNSFVWKDIVNEVTKWQEGFDMERANLVNRSKQDNPSTASVLLEMGDINGRIMAANYILNLPDLFLSILEEKSDDIISE